MANNAVMVKFISGWFYIMDDAENFLQSDSTPTKVAFAGFFHAAGYIDRPAAERVAKEIFGFTVVDSF